MGTHTVILGSPIKGNKQPGKIRLITPTGDVLSINENDIVHQGNADSGGDLKRYAVSSDAPVLLETTAGKFVEPAVLQLRGQKDKYMDDHSPHIPVPKSVADLIRFP